MSSSPARTPFLERLFRLSRFEDRLEAVRARAFAVMLLLSFSLGTALLVGSPLLNPPGQRALTLALYGSLLIAVLSAGVMLRVGRLRLGGAVFSITVWAMSAIVIMLYGGLKSHMPVAAVAVVVIAAFVWGEVPAVALAILYSLLGLAFSWAQATGLIPWTAAEVSWWRPWIAFTGVLAAAAALILLGIRGMRRAFQETRLSEERLARMIANAPDGIALLDAEGRVLSQNPAAGEISGYSEEEIRGRSFYDLGIVQTDDASRAHQEFQRVLAGGPVGPSEVEIVRKSGERVTVEVNRRLVVSPRGERQVQVIIRDISARKQAEESQARLEGQLRQAQKMESIGRLAGGVAHDFNNLLTVIVGNADLLKTQLDERSSARQAVDEIGAAAERAAALTGQLLAFSRKQVLEPRLLDLKDIVDDTKKLLHRLIGEDIEIVVTGSEEVAAIRADPGQIEQVIMNVASNSRDAMPSGGRLTIDVRNVALDDGFSQAGEDIAPGDYVRLAISDTGQGMDDETMGLIFEPFYTSKEAGTGLGLATVHGIVRQSGGYIGVSSREGVGTTIEALFPATAELPQTAPEDGRESASHEGNETVLLVEDESGVREVVYRILAMAGYRVLLAGNFDEAVTLWNRHRHEINLLVTDVVMPGGSGADLARDLRTRSPVLKVLFISGYADAAIAHHGVLDEGLELLTKPFTRSQLTSKVRQVLDS